MSEAEERELDLVGRMTFAQQAADGVVRFARSLPTYGGAFFDQQRDGGLVIQLTEPDAAIEADLLSMAPPGRSTSIQYVTSTFRELRGAMNEVRSLWAKLDGAPPLYRAGIDEIGNRLRLGVGESSSDTIAQLEAEVERALSVPATLAVVDPPAEEACNPDRDYCDPIAAGARIRRGSTTGTNCTMAVYVESSSGAIQALTAGHCGWSGSNAWYHTGYGFLGYEKATQYGTAGRDIMRFDVPNAEANRAILGDTRIVNHAGDPITGDNICASLGQTQSWDCGTVADALDTWGPTGTACNCVIEGAIHQNISTQNGDSGSPIVRLVGTTEWIAVGVHNTAFGGFARVGDSLDYWSNWSIYRP